MVYTVFVIKIEMVYMKVQNFRRFREQVAGKEDFQKKKKNWEARDQAGQETLVS